MVLPHQQRRSSLPNMQFTGHGTVCAAKCMVMRTIHAHVGQILQHRACKTFAKSAAQTLLWDAAGSGPCPSGVTTEVCGTVNLRVCQLDGSINSRFGASLASCKATWQGARLIHARQRVHDHRALRQGLHRPAVDDVLPPRPLIVLWPVLHLRLLSVLGTAVLQL